MTTATIAANVAIATAEQDKRRVRLMDMITAFDEAIALAW